MRAFVCLIMMMGLAACTGTVRQAENNIWPADPQERSAAQRVVAKMEGNVLLATPPGMEFSHRRLVGNIIQDYYTYRLDRLQGLDLLNAIRRNMASNYVREQGYRACRDRDFRYLLDKGYVHEFRVAIFGTKKSGVETDKISKGFCIANEVPLIDQNAIDARYSKIRYWPNGDRIDPRLIEQVMGSFRVATAKYQPSDLGKFTIRTVSTEADGLMLTRNMEKEQKITIKGSKYWPQHIKGQALEKSCTNKASLTALMVGGVYRFQVDVKVKQEIIEDGAFTISYPDCLLYNKKP